MSSLELPQIELPAFVMRDWQGRGNRSAIVDADGSRSISYAELADAVRRSASALLARGVAHGDVIAMCMPNSPDLVVAYYAALAAGAVVTTLSPDITEPEATALLADSPARRLMTTPDRADMLARAVGPKPVELLVVPGGFPPTADGATMRPRTVDPDELAVLLYSSGTTGLPKQVMLTHRNLTAALCSMRGPDPVNAGDVLLAAVPLCHIAGMQIAMNHALESGATLVTLGRLELGAVLVAIERHRVTRMIAPPPVVLGLAKHPDVDRYDLSSLRVVTSGGAPLAPETAERAARRIGCRIKQGYGMTESAPICWAPDDGPDRPESIGPPAPGVECRVVDPITGADLAVGEAGELLARSAAQMRGYFANETATAATIDADGWLHTGDLVRVDEDGWFHVVGRLKELIKCYGRQVAPAELEQLLLAHPAVADAAVIGIPDEEAGEVPKALVVLRAPVPPSELMAHVAGRVSPHKHLRHIEVVAEIPRSPSGKILRRMLAEREPALTNRRLTMPARRDELRTCI